MEVLKPIFELPELSFATLELAVGIPKVFSHNSVNYLIGGNWDTSLV